MISCLVVYYTQFHCYIPSTTCITLAQHVLYDLIFAYRYYYNIVYKNACYSIISIYCFYLHQYTVDFISFYCCFMVLIFSILLTYRPTWEGVLWFSLWLRAGFLYFRLIDDITQLYYSNIIIFL